MDQHTTSVIPDDTAKPKPARTARISEIDGKECWRVDSSHGLVIRTCPEHALINMVIMGPYPVDTEDEDRDTEEEAEKDADSLDPSQLRPTSSAEE